MAPYLGSLLILKTNRALILCIAVLPSVNTLLYLKLKCFYCNLLSMALNVRVLYTRGYGRILRTDF
jgi:hypothetical protein